MSCHRTLLHPKKMHKTKTITILFAGVLQALPALAGITPLPSSFAGSTTDYIVFDGSSYPGQNLICFSGGCGGGFQGTVYGPGSTTATGPSTLTTVWCVDYQLDVTPGSQYIANTTTLNAITLPGDNNVRYGDLNTVSPSGATSGWTNAVTDPTNLDGGQSNSAAYRYTLAAALVSQYADTTPAPDPTNLDGGSAVNQAIQQAIWYITYNSEYQSGATWPPPGLGLTSPASCSSAQSVTNSTGNTDYACWVQYAEANANTVNTNGWAVVSGPADASGNLLAPSTTCAYCNGYPSYQTFLVQEDSNGIVTHGNSPATPEPTYFLLTSGLGGLMLFVRRRKARKQS